MNKVTWMRVLLAIASVAVVGCTVMPAAAPVRAQDPAPQDAPSLTVSIKASDPRIRYVGRFDTRDPKGPKCEWTASQVQLRFHGTRLNAELNEVLKDVQFQVVVDGWPKSVLSVLEGHHVYSLVEGLPDDDHSVTLFRRTEAFTGNTQFVAFQLDRNARLLAPPPALKRRVQVIGDSISCGYGNLAKSEKDHFLPVTEDGYLAYGALGARSLNAEYRCIAWSGKKLWPDNSIVDLYGLSTPTDSTSRYDEATWVPDVILINLGTNDTGKGVPDKKGWEDAYVAFIRHLRVTAPHAMIYLALGPMMTDGWPPNAHALSSIRGYLHDIIKTRQSAGDTRMRFIEFNTQDQKDGMGADYHPNIKTDVEMAEEFKAAVERDLGW